MYILKNKIIQILFLLMLFLIPNYISASQGFEIPNLSVYTSLKGCETNTIKNGNVCLWEEGTSWCGLNEQICQIEPTGGTPAPIANGSYSFSCSSCQYELNCDANYKACNDSCVAILNCEPNEVFDACSNSCISAPSTGSGFLASNPFFYLSESAYVGIGTNNPLTKLHLYDNTNGPVISLSGLNSNYRGLTTRDLNNDEMWFMGNNNANNFVIRRNATSNDLTINSTTGIITLSTTTVSGKLTANQFCIGSNCATSWDLSNWASSGSDIYRASGKVGIGTESPSTALHVLGTTTASAFCLGTSCINAWPGGGNGEVSSISSDNNSLTINPINGTGDVDVSLNLNNINTWTASQTFNATTTFPNNSILNTAGDLGLGTSTPVTKLHLFHNTSGPIISLSGLTNHYRGLAIRDINNTENWFIGSNHNNKFVIRRQEEDSNDIVVNSDGNVGIGTDAPETKLHVVGTTTFQNAVAIGPPTDVNHAVTKLYVDDLNINWAKLQNFPSSCPDGEYVTGIDSSLTCSTPSSTDSLWSELSSDIYRLNGSVGIGTSTPQAKLQINADAGRQALFIIPSNSSPLTIRDSENSTNIWEINQFGQLLAGNVPWERLTGDPPANVVNNWSVEGDHVYRLNGSVGIGTSSPLASLHVVGNIIANSPTSGDHVATRQYVDSSVSWNKLDGTNIANSNSGNVLIGTSTGESKLTVNGSIEGANLFIGRSAVVTNGKLIRSADGSASSPGFSFGSETSLGMYRAGADSLAFSTNQIERLRINASGYVGIGTDTPESILHIKESSEVELIIEGGSPKIDLRSPVTGNSHIISFSNPLPALNGSIEYEYFLDGSVTKYRMNFLSYSEFNFNNEVNIANGLNVTGSIRGNYYSNDGSAGINRIIGIKNSDNTTCYLDIKNGIIVNTNCSVWTDPDPR